MHRNRILGLLLLAVVLATLAAGVYGLIGLRLTRGDAYPAYSTLRADPVGTKMLFDSLAEVPGLTVERRYQPLETHPIAEPATLFILGVRPYEMHSFYKPYARSLDRFVATGGRLVVCFAPVTYRTTRDVKRARARELEREFEDEPPEEQDEAKTDDEQKEEVEKKVEQEARDGAGNDTEPEEEKLTPREKKRKERFERWYARNFVSVTNTWRVDYGFARLAWQDEPPTNTSVNPFDEFFEETDDAGETGTDYAYEVGVHVASAADIPWHSTMFFETLDPAWRTLYQRGEYPVIVERAFGRGSIVLCSDAYFTSNEALVRDRQTALLAHLAGTSGRILFDEVHFGIVKQPGVMELARRYGLQGLLGALLLLAGLFIWRNATSLVPSWESQAGASLDIVAGEQAGEGFVRQLRRHLRASDLPQLCFEEWRKTADTRAARHGPRAAKMQAALADYAARKPAERNPVAAYRTLCELLNEKGRGA